MRQAWVGQTFRIASSGQHARTTDPKTEHGTVTVTAHTQHSHSTQSQHTVKAQSQHQSACNDPGLLERIKVSLRKKGTGTWRVAAVWGPRRNTERGQNQAQVKDTRLGGTLGDDVDVLLDAGCVPGRRELLVLKKYWSNNRIARTN